MFTVALCLCAERAYIGVFERANTELIVNFHKSQRPAILETEYPPGELWLAAS